MVIKGISANIVNVENSKDVYDKGETLFVSGILIGPADGAVKLQNLNLVMKVFNSSNNNTEVLYLKEEIDKLGFDPVSFSFLKKLDFSLYNYEIVLLLMNEEEVLDKVELSYYDLEPEYKYKEGRIVKSDFVGCFDNGICDIDERNSGNCYDCYLDDIKKSNDNLTEIVDENDVEKKSINYVIFYVFVGFLLLLGVGLLFVIRREKNE